MGWAAYPGAVAADGSSSAAIRDGLHAAIGALTRPGTTAILAVAVVVVFSSSILAQPLIAPILAAAALAGTRRAEDALRLAARNPLALFGAPLVAMLPLAIVAFLLAFLGALVALALLGDVTPTPAIDPAVVADAIGRAGTALAVVGPVVLVAVAFAAYLLVRLTFAAYAAADGDDLRSALSRSWSLTRGRTLRVAGWHASAIALLAPTSVAGSWAIERALSAVGLSPTVAVLAFLGYLALAPAAWWVPLYRELRSAAGPNDDRAAATEERE